MKRVVGGDGFGPSFSSSWAAVMLMKPPVATLRWANVWATVEVGVPEVALCRPEWTAMGVHSMCSLQTALPIRFVLPLWSFLAC
jgi:hypothetical protein